MAGSVCCCCFIVQSHCSDYASPLRQDKDTKTSCCPGTAPRWAWRCAAGQGNAEDTDRETKRED
ncbi:UNVERIFIED_CONTAM: hypothetical protein FKN15_026882 [Acipenser sinensis]